MSNLEKAKIRTRFVQGNILDVKILITHPMETGLRKDAKGQIIPALFIKELTVSLNNTVILKNNWSQAVSKNPFLGIKVRNAKVGDKIKLEWVDNLGARESAEQIITAA